MRRPHVRVTIQGIMIIVIAAAVQSWAVVASGPDPALSLVFLGPLLGVCAATLSTRDRPLKYLTAALLGSLAATVLIEAWLIARMTSMTLARGGGVGRAHAEILVAAAVLNQMLGAVVGSVAEGVILVPGLVTVMWREWRESARASPIPWQEPMDWLYAFHPGQACDDPAPRDSIARSGSGPNVTAREARG
jgi:hypothetical protein